MIDTEPELQVALNGREESHGSRIVRNALFNLGTQAWLGVFAVVSTPIMLRFLGPDAFGLWVTVNVISGYFIILDFGFTRGTVKYLSQYIADGDRASASAVMQNAVLLFLAIGLAGAAAVAVGGTLFLRYVLDVPAGLEHTAEVVFFLAAVSFFINMASTPLTAIPMALQRFEYVNARVIVTSSASLMGWIVLLLLGFNLVGLVALSAFVNGIVALAFIPLVRRLAGPIGFSPRFHRAMFLRLAKFSGLKFVSNLSDQAVFQLDRLLVGAFLPIAAVAYYSVPAMAIQRILPIAGNITNAAFPAISAASDRALARDLYLLASRMIGTFVLPVCVFAGIFAHPILMVWAGQDIAARSTLTFQVLSLAAMVAALAGAPAMANEAIGRVHVTTLFAVFSAVLNVSLNVVLIPQFGFGGAAWAFLINMSIQVPVFIFVTNRAVALHQFTWIRDSVAKPVTALVVPAFLSAFLVPFASHPAVLIFACSAFMGGYALLATAIVATRHERGVLWSLGCAAAASARVFGRSLGTRRPSRRGVVGEQRGDA